jgi:hypothetical protein
MPASRYDIYAEQGTTFKLYMDYKYAGSTGINLNGFSGAMQIRRSAKEDNVLLYLTTTGVTGCGSTGYFNSSGIDGVRGIGGISFNTSISGTSGYTGGILFRVDHTTMKYIPYGKHFYDFEFTNTLGEVFRLIEGTFEVSREMTRT